MSRKPVPAQSGDRSRAEIVFDKPQLMPQLFGEFDKNLLQLESRLGVYIRRGAIESGWKGAQSRSLKRATCCRACTTASPAANASIRAWSMR